MVRMITDKQLHYLRRLIKYSHQRLRAEDASLCTSLQQEIDTIGIENLTLDLAKKYIDDFLALEDAYCSWYEKEVHELDEATILELFKIIPRFKNI